MYTRTELAQPSRVTQFTPNSFFGKVWAGNALGLAALRPLYCPLAVEMPTLMYTIFDQKKKRFYSIFGHEPMPV